MRKGFATWIYLWVPVAAWCGLIYFLSGIPHLSSGLEYDFFLRKMAHALEYAILAGLLWRAIEGSAHWSIRRIFIVTIVLCILYAASDEWHQSFVDSRTPAIRDVVIDVFGALAAGLLFTRMRSFRIR